MDRAMSATWVAESELHPDGAGARLAAVDAATHAAGANACGGSESAARGAATRQLQAGASDVEHRGGERAGDVAGVE